MNSKQHLKHIKLSLIVSAMALLLGLASYILRQRPPTRQDPPATTAVRMAAAHLSQLDPEQDAVRQLKAHGLYDSLLAAMEAARARFEPLARAPARFAEAAYQASNPWRGMGACFAPSGVQIVPQAPDQSWHWTIRLNGYGYGDLLQCPAAAETVAQANRLEYRRGALTEWYDNDRRGFEQGFTLAEPPAVASDSLCGPLVLAMSVDTDLQARLNEQADAIEFVNDQGQTVLHYAALKAWDANGQPLRARMELCESQLSLLVDDTAAVYPVVIDPLIFTETELTASDKAAFDQFGHSVAISGDTVVVGARGHDVPANDLAGAAYVFVRSGTTWTLQAKLTSSDNADGARFGNSVTVSGDTVVVAAAVRADAVAGADVGAAYVFVRGGTTWTQQAILTASDKADGDEFGYSVAVNGDTVVVGAPFHADPVAGANAGAAYVFVRSGTTWTEQAELTAPEKALGDFFGISVGVSGDTVVVASQPGLEAAYVFVRSGTTWTLQAELTAADVLGESVAISGDTVVVGSPFHDDPVAGANAGAAYVFVRSGTTWTLQTQLTASDKSGGDGFLVPGDQFGDFVAVSGDTVVVGSRFHDDTVAGANAGAAYVFVRSGTIWTQQAQLTASDKARGDLFGESVAISGDTVVVGADLHDDAVAGEYAGAAYVYANPPPTAICHNVARPADANCQATVIAAEVDNGSSDPGGDPITLSLSPAGPYPLGTTTVTLRVADNRGGYDNCAATVTVIDAQAPTVTCSVNQAILSAPWPPNHNLVNVGLSATATDNCSQGSVPVTVKVFGDENDEAQTGDAIFSPDAANVGSGTLRLRQERNSKSNGRVYLIVVTASDASGNVGVSCCTVGVPLNLSNAEIISVNAQAAAAQAYCLSHTGAAPPGYFVIGDGPIVGPKQ